MSILSNTLRKFTSDMEAADSALKQQRTSHSDVADYIIKELDRGIKEKEYHAPKRRYLPLGILALASYSTGIWGRRKTKIKAFLLRHYARLRLVIASKI